MRGEMTSFMAASEKSIKMQCVDLVSVQGSNCNHTSRVSKQQIHCREGAATIRSLLGWKGLGYYGCVHLRTSTLIRDIEFLIRNKDPILEDYPI